MSLLPSLAGAEDHASPMLLTDVVTQRAEQLAAIDSDETAMTLFTTTVGPALGLKDAAGALGATRLPSKIVKELRLAELSESVSELMGALAAWQLAESVGRNANQSSTTSSLPAARQDWLHTRSRNASLSDLFRLSQEHQTLGTPETRADQRNTELLLVAQRTAFESSRQATKAWWDVYWWKDRIRQAKGLARLCGTWQWTIHNHQNHGDQKAVVMFPPAGQASAHTATPAETIVLGDAIYLRWEQNGRIQEDSLLFIKDDAKIEGSFVNNTGGWGSITGKRTAACQP
ncbi:MAG: hypothetical protein OEV99_14665 [Nitrospira sp.]|nr:hypothetical protein [Nitrospira sp.]MDH4371065.1 hypothetical protein [Nitrospira sp.]